MKFNLNTLEFIDQNIDENKLAIIGSNKVLTWKEFHNQVTLVKNKIRNLNVKSTKNPIIIYGHKEAEFLVYITACMSLNIPYIPLDTIYPQERIEAIANLSHSSAVIYTQTNQIEVKNLSLDKPSLQDNVIYVIYTSGSTGTPKGVQISKDAILSFIDWIQQDFKFNQDSIFINQALLSFDLSVIDIFSTLLLGGTILLASRELIEHHNQFIEQISQYKCNVFATTPSFIAKTLMIQEFNQTDLPNLTNFVLIGEVLPPIIAKKLLKNFQNATLVNSYGPTEATFGVTRIQITPEIIDKYSKVLPIGYPKGNQNSKIEIINKNHKDVGEIVIYGNNVSVGYVDLKLNDKFVTEDNIRTFHTSDLGYIHDNMLFFAGRKDNQIKFNGYRIEIDEIDSAMLKIDGIKATITLPLKRDIKILRLVSFIILNDTTLNKDIITQKLLKTLPEYMLPSDIMFIDKFNYTPSQKLDTKNLIEQYKNS